MYADSGGVRPHYAALAERLARLNPREVERRRYAAELSFQARGITFAVNQGPEGLEKIMPFDLIPRVITAEEWHTIERGLEQRVRALNLFLRDVYHEQRIIADGSVPAEVIFGSQGYRRELCGLDVPLDVCASAMGAEFRHYREGCLRATGEASHAILVPYLRPPLSAPRPQCKSYRQVSLPAFRHQQLQ